MEILDYGYLKWVIAVLVIGHALAACGMWWQQRRRKAGRTPSPPMTADRRDDDGLPQA